MNGVKILKENTKNNIKLLKEYHKLLSADKEKMSVNEALMLVSRKTLDKLYQYGYIDETINGDVKIITVRYIR